MRGREDCHGSPVVGRLSGGPHSLLPLHLYHGGRREGTSMSEGGVLGLQMVGG